MRFDTRKPIGKIILKETFRWGIEIFIVVAIAYGLYYNFGEKASIIGNSMEITLQDNDEIIINKLAYKFNEPKRFDVIVFTVESSGKEYYVKRIIGLPGETLQIIDGEVWIDNELLEEMNVTDLISDSGSLANPLTLMEDEYFVLGDNRNNSEDSRFNTIGIVSKESIIGKAWLRIYPINKIQIIDYLNRLEYIEAEPEK